MKIREICNITMGQSPSSATYNENGDGLPFFQGAADFGKKFPMTRVWCSSPLKIAYAGDILISVRAPVGTMNIATSECCIGRGLASIKVDEDACDSNYFWFALESKISELNNKGSGSTFKAISKSILEETEIPLPELEEQRKIAKILTGIENISFARQQQLAKLDELVKARFVEMFGDLAAPDCLWLSVRLIDTCENQDAIKCGPFGTQLSKEEYKSDGVAVWEIPQINSQFVSSPTHYLTEEKAKQLQSYSICPGDIAMSRKGNVGKCAVFPKEFEPGIIHSDVLRIRVDQKRVLPVFMMCQLHFSKAVQHQIKLVSSGAIMAGINVTKLKKIYVHIPPMDLQRRFVAFVESVDKTKLSIQNGLEQMEILKKALMQKYFG